MSSLREQRNLASALLDSSNPVDAPTAYYALYHDQARSALFVRGDRSNPQGFVGRFQTGMDLFRPLVTLRCRDATVAADLLAEALIVGRPYILFCLMNQYILVGGSMDISNERILSIYTLDRARFKAEINVLVTHGKTPQGTPRAMIEAGGQRAVAGVNWQSPGFAEVYVDVDPAVRQKGWGRSVLVACCERVLAGGRQPIYLVEPSNTASVRLAESAGFVDSGARQVYADAIYTGHPAR
ncbi:MAG: GNAT family N-acetyltransferase [Anaerolineae bacterium]|nr:GNAT family N-acetyltransferase [Anaerolineae bacterium]